MRDFQVIYRILSKYRGLLETPGNPTEAITPETLDTSVHHMKSILVMLGDAGHLKNIVDNGGSDVSYRKSEITLKGLEYLVDSEIMKAAAKEQGR